MKPAGGGEYTEGIVGQPAFINPLFADENNADQDITELTFSDLKNMIDSYQVSPDNKTFDVRLKPDIFWQDNQPITSDDVLFTISAVQDPDINSPQAASWQGVKAERISEREFQLILPQPYAYFENILLDFKPIPKHIFENIPLTNLRLSEYNLEPVGSGPYKFTGYDKRRDGFVTKYSVEKSDSYFGPKPYIQKMNFNFYTDDSELVKAFNSSNIDGFAVNNFSQLNDITIPHQTFDIKMPRYYAVFFNQANNPLLADKNLRIALNSAINKQRIVNDVFGGKAITIDGPIVLDNSNNDEYNVDYANQLLDSEGWQMTDSGVRVKGNDRLEFNLTVYPIPFLIDTAKMIQEDWSKIGVRADINLATLNNFTEQVIRPRNYDMLIFGNAYGENEDPYSFWDSTQKFYPGLNFALYDNKSVDSAINSIRTEFDPNLREGEMEQLQSAIIADQPAIFLYSPDYIYIANNLLKGFEEQNLGLPSDRFANIQNWFIKTTRVLKK